MPATAEQPRNPVGTSEVAPLTEVEIGQEESAEQPIVPSKEMLDAVSALKKARENSANTDSLLDWLTNEDPEFTATLADVQGFLANEENASPEDKAELKLLEKILELREKLPKVLEQFNTKVAELAGPAEYTKLKEKKEEVIKALADPVVNGHIEANELVSMIEGGVLLASREEMDKLCGAGYEGAMCCDFRNQRIYISTEAMKDSYTTREGKLLKGGIDLRHSINHEISHQITARLLSKNAALAEQAEAIIKGAKNQDRDLQPTHVRNVLDSLGQVESNFEKLWTEKHKDDTEPANAELKADEKEAYVTLAKKQAADEIITDYTALYMQSDGSFAGFFEKCFSQIGNEGKGKFGIKLRAVNEFYARLSQADGADKEKILNEMKVSLPAFTELSKTYSAFYGEIQKALTERGGKLLLEEGDEEDDFESFYPSGVAAEPAAACRKNEPQKGDGDIKTAFYGFMKAFSEEVDVTKTLQ